MIIALVNIVPVPVSVYLLSLSTLVALWLSDNKTTYRARNTGRRNKKHLPTIRYPMRVSSNTGSEAAVSWRPLWCAECAGMWPPPTSTMGPRSATPAEHSSGQPMMRRNVIASLVIVRRNVKASLLCFQANNHSTGKWKNEKIPVLLSPRWKLWDRYSWTKKMQLLSVSEMSFDWYVYKTETWRCFVKITRTQGDWKLFFTSHTKPYWISKCDYGRKQSINDSCYSFKQLSLIKRVFQNDADSSSPQLSCQWGGEGEVHQAALQHPVWAWPGPCQHFHPTSWGHQEGSIIW